MAERSLYAKELALVVVLLAAVAFSVSYIDFVATGKAISQSEIPEWAGVPWNVFNNQPAITVTPDPVQITSGMTRVVVEARGEFLRKVFYVFNRDENRWIPYEFEIAEGGQAHTKPEWLKNAGRKEIEISSKLLYAKNYIAAATCHRDAAGQLKCGCRYETECDKWQVQSFAVSSIAGDLNSDKKVDFEDYLAFVNSFGKATGENGYNERADIDTAAGSAGRVDFEDFLVFSQTFGVNLDLLTSRNLGASANNALGEVLTPKTARCSAYDYNSDGNLDLNDMRIIEEVYYDNSKASSHAGKTFDLNNDNKVDLSDFEIWSTNPACAAGTTLTFTCTDSDGGKEYLVKGTTHEGGDSDYTATDTCLDGTRLSENYCATQASTGYPNRLHTETYTCPNGCNDGACKTDVSGGTSATAATIPSTATFTACRGGKYDFSGDGKVDTGDIRPDNCNSLNCAHAFREGITGQKCPANLFCAGRFVTEAEYVALPAFASKCVELDKTVKTVCDDPQHDLNSDGRLDILDAVSLIDITKQASPSCTSGKICDVKNDGILNFNDVTRMFSIANGCSGSSIIDYNSDGVFTAADVTLLRNVYASSVSQRSSDLITLKTVCFGSEYDFLGEGSATSVSQPDSKLTRVDIGPNGGASGSKNGQFTAGISDLKDPFNRQCPTGTFCAGRVPTAADVKKLSDTLASCNSLYSNYPSVKNADYTASFISENSVDLNGDGKVDGVDLAALTSRCPTGKVCDLDGSGTGPSDVNAWLRIVSIYTLFK